MSKVQFVTKTDINFKLRGVQNNILQIL